jgi:protease YdgD
MSLKPLTIALTLLLTATAANANPIPLELATDESIADLPTRTEPSNAGKLNLEAKLKEPRTRGIICKPGDALDACDKRVPVQSRNYPWSSIGRLQIGDDGHCTATLIDDDWILTNAHCIIDRATNKVTTESLTFLPNLINGKLTIETDRARVIRVIAGTDFKDSDIIPHPEDWAMLKIDQPLGKKYGTIGWKAIPSALLIKKTNQFTLTGYSGDFPSKKLYPRLSAGPGYTAGMHKQCSFMGEQADKVLIHDCNMRAGASGSAILGWIDDKPYIVAINSAESHHKHTGIAIENYAVNVTQINVWFEKQKAKKKP